jgi:hypothetical protein
LQLTLSPARWTSPLQARGLHWGLQWLKAYGLGSAFDGNTVCRRHPVEIPSLLEHG